MWQWRIKAPADLRPTPYRSQWAHRCSLETAELRAANAAAAQLQAEWTARFEQQRRLKTTQGGEAPLSLTGVRTALLAQMRLELEAFDARTVALTADDRQSWDLATDVELDEVQQALEDKRWQPAAVELLKRALAPRGLRPEDLGSQVEPAALLEAQLAYGDLLVLKSEAATDESRSFRQRVARLGHRAALVKAAAPSAQPQALSEWPSGPTPEHYRAIHGLSVADGKLKLSEMFARYFQAERSRWKNPEHAERRDYGPYLRAFLEVIGDRTLETLSVTDTLKFKQHVESLATAPRNQAKYLERVGAVLRWANSVALLSDLTAPLKMRLRDDDSYEAFTIEELQRLFETPQYEQSSFSKPSHFWLPLLGLYTGARINELASLQLRDVTQSDDQHVLLLSREGRKTGKNEYSRRTVPVHPRLVHCGFLDYVTTLRAEGQTELFSDVRGAARDGKGKYPSRDFTAYRRSCGVGESEGRSSKVFHSFRSSLVSSLQRAGVPAEIRREIVGHAASDVHERVYSQGEVPLQVKADALAKAVFDFEHPVWRDTPAQREARIRP